MDRVDDNGAARVELKRTLSVPLLVLYGVGVTVGAGIYVLVGAASARAGALAPIAFLIAALVMGLTGATFAELAGRVPLSAGEAAYVRAGFKSDRIALLIGALVFGVATVSAAAIAKGTVGYLQFFVSWPVSILTIVTVLSMGLIASYGIREAVSVAAIMTVIEVGGLLAIIIGGFASEPNVIGRALSGAAATPIDAAVFRALAGSFLLAFFAFIGFESIVNLAEEAHAPVRAVPQAILLTLIIATALYIAVVIVAMAAVPVAELGASKAPLTLVFQRTTGGSPALISLIAIIATINGIIAQIILASRVLYGLSRQEVLPAWLGVLNERTQTPQLATALVTAVVLVLALLEKIDRLADVTSLLMLAVFTAVNAALVVIKLRGDEAPRNGVIVPIAVPIAGAVSCAAMLLAGLLL